MTEESWIAKDPRAQKPRAPMARGSFADESGANQSAPTTQPILASTGVRMERIDGGVSNQAHRGGCKQ